MVFTSGTVDEQPLRAERVPQYCHACPAGLGGWGVEPGAGIRGVESLTHCWALRDQARTPRLCGGGSFWFFGLPGPGSAVGWRLAGVGMHLEIWIVDASILRQVFTRICRIVVSPDVSGFVTLVFVVFVECL